MASLVTHPAFRLPAMAKVFERQAEPPPRDMNPDKIGFYYNWAQRESVARAMRAGRRGFAD